MEIPFLLGRKIDSDSEFNMDGRLYEIIDGRDNSVKLHQTLTQDLENKTDTKKMKI